MKLKRILYVTDIVGLGGGETSLLTHLDGLDRERFTPIVLCSKTGMLTDELINRGIETKIVYWGRVKRISKFIVYCPLISFLKLVFLLSKQYVDIVNVNTFNAMALTAPAAKLYRIPVVWTCHGWWPTGRLTGIYINYFVDKIIAVSNFVKDKLQKEGHVNASKIVQIPLGIDPSKYPDSKSSEAIRREFNLNRDVPVVGMVGRFQEIKGHHVFVRMAAEISKTHPHVRFIMVGSEVFGKSSESDYGREIHKLIYKHALKKNIILTGFRQDVSQILGALDVLVVPSQFETFGMVILEAMAAGIPVVSCAKGGPTEIIEDGKNGFILSDQNPKQLANRVLFLIENPQTATIMGLEGRKTITERFNSKHIINEIEGIYETLLRKN